MVAAVPIPYGSLLGVIRHSWNLGNPKVTAQPPPGGRSILWPLVTLLFFSVNLWWLYTGAITKEESLTHMNRGNHAANAQISVTKDYAVSASGKSGGKCGPK